MQSIRIIEIPAGKAVSSGVGMFGEEKFDGFGDWFSSLPREAWPRDYLFFENGGMHWIYLLREGILPPEGYAVIDFDGGLYAVATDIDQATDMDAMAKAVDAFLADHVLIRDPSRPDLGNVISSPAAAEILGYEQMDYYTPIKKKEV